MSEQCLRPRDYSFILVDLDLQAAAFLQFLAIETGSDVFVLADLNLA